MDTRKYDLCKCGSFKLETNKLCNGCRNKDRVVKEAKGCDKHPVKNAFCMDCIRKYHPLKEVI